MIISQKWLRIIAMTFQLAWRNFKEGSSSSFFILPVVAPFCSNNISSGTPDYCNSSFTGICVIGLFDGSPYNRLFDQQKDILSKVSRKLFISIIKVRLYMFVFGTGIQSYSDLVIIVTPKKSEPSRRKLKAKSKL
jgi:hypothetical protein